MALTSMVPAIQQQKRIFLLITEHAIPFRETQVLLRKELYLLAGMWPNKEFQWSIITSDTLVRSHFSEATEVEKRVYYLEHQTG